MPFAKVNGIDIYYEIHGQGKPIVFLSGFSTRHKTWLPFIEPLIDYQLILLDNRGAGQTTAPPPPYTIETMADDTIGLLDHLSIDVANMIGSSMGTAIIQSLSYKYPERIDKGILIAPFPKLPAASLLKSIVTGKLIAQKLPVELVIETAIPWLFSRDFVSDPQKVAEKIEEMTVNSYPQSPEGFLGQIAAMKQFDSSTFLNKLQTKFLLIAGEEDLSSPLWCAKYLHEHLPHSILRTFPRVAHMAHVERRDEVINLIKAFIPK